VSLLVLSIASPVSSALYSCTESGVSVITDTPAQLRGCTLLAPDRAAVPERTAPTPEAHPPRSPEAGPSQAPAVQPADLAIPLERLGSLFVVTIQVNETRAAKLILDTGASHTILSYAVARDLGLWALHRADTVTMQTVGGSVQADLLPIASIRIGDVEVRNTLAAIYDLPEAPPGIEGLLGQSVLDSFTVTLDTARNRLHLKVQP
jgi:clan AA aspartic protease (TIGR02281 family)